MRDIDRAGHDEEVSLYYKEAWFGYRWFWQNRQNRALHFGYWDDDTKRHGDSLLNMNREVARPLDLQPGTRVLDAGCGVGGSAMWLVENHGVDAVGITIAGSQVELANRFASKRGLQDRIRFEEGDYCNTGFADGSFDVVWALESSCHAEDKSRFLKEAFRVLRPGGHLAVGDWFRTARPLEPDDEDLLHGWLSCWVIPDLETIDDYVQLTKEAGFVDVTARDISPQVRPSLRHLYRVSVLSFPPSWLAYHLRLNPERTYRNHIGGLRQWRTVKRGLWAHALIHAQKAS